MPATVHIMSAPCARLCGVPAGLRDRLWPVARAVVPQDESHLPARPARVQVLDERSVDVVEQVGAHVEHQDRLEDRVALGLRPEPLRRVEELKRGLRAFFLKNDFGACRRRTPRTRSDLKVA